MYFIFYMQQQRGNVRVAFSGIRISIGKKYNCQVFYTAGKLVSARPFVRSASRFGALNLPSLLFVCVCGSLALRFSFLGNTLEANCVCNMRHFRFVEAKQNFVVKKASAKAFEGANKIKERNLGQALKLHTLLP